MKNTLKISFYDKFINSLENDEALSELQKRYVANKLSIEALEVYEDNFKKLSELYKEVSINNEKTRSQFIGMVNFIEKSTKSLIDSFKKQGFVKIDTSIGNKNNMVGRTTMVTDMVKYLNSLNLLVINFYKDIYQIEKVDAKEKEKEKIQASLF